MTADAEWRPIDTAPRPEPLYDWGPVVELRTPGGDLVGRYCGGLEVGEIWMPPGWYSDGDEIEPTHWRPSAEGKAP